MANHMIQLASTINVSSGLSIMYNHITKIYLILKHIIIHGPTETIGRLYHRIHDLQIRCTGDTRDSL